MFHKLFFVFLMILSATCGGYVLMSACKECHDDLQGKIILGLAALLVLVFLFMAWKICIHREPSEKSLAEK